MARRGIRVRGRLSAAGGRGEGTGLWRDLGPLVQLEVEHV